jgi:hypothetical protein
MENTMIASVIRMTALSLLTWCAAIVTFTLLLAMLFLGHSMKEVVKQSRPRTETDADADADTDADADADTDATESGSDLYLQTIQQRLDRCLELLAALHVALERHSGGTAVEAEHPIGRRGRSLEGHN